MYSRLKKRKIKVYDGKKTNHRQRSEALNFPSILTFSRKKIIKMRLLNLQGISPGREPTFLAPRNCRRMRITANPSVFTIWRLWIEVIPIFQNPLVIQTLC